MRILVPMDGSEKSWEAFDYAVEQFPGDTVVCLNVIDPVQSGYGMDAGAAAAANQWPDAQEAAAEELFEAVRERAAADVDVETTTEVGRPAQTIAEFAESCDHVVMGSHGRDGVSRILLGSVAETVVRRSPVPVTVVR